MPTLVVSAGPVGAAVTGPLPAAVKPVWVDGGDDGDVRGVHQLRDVVNTAQNVNERQFNISKRLSGLTFLSIIDKGSLH